MLRFLEGWIKLFRKILLNERIWKSREPFDKRSAWMDLLLNASPFEIDETIGYQKVHLMPGQLFITYRYLAVRWRWSKNKVARFLVWLSSVPDPELKVERLRVPQGVLLTIIKWELYQGERDSNEPDNGVKKGTATDHEKDISREYKELKNKEPAPPAVDLSTSPTSSQQKEEPWDTLKRKWKEYFREDITNKQIGKLVGKRGLYGFLFVEAITQAVDECHKQVKENAYGFFLVIAKEGARVEPFIRRAREKFKAQQDKIGYEDFKIPKRRK